MGGRILYRLLYDEQLFWGNAKESEQTEKGPLYTA